MHFSNIKPYFKKTVFEQIMFPSGSHGKDLPAMQETWVQSLGWEDHVEKGMASYSSVLPGESHGQRSLVGYSPWGRKESDTTE